MDGITPPLDYSKLHMFVPNSNTRKLYEKNWNSFVKFSSITEEKVPDQNSFFMFLQNRREEGKLAGKSLQALLAGLSTMCQYFYSFKLDKVRTMMSFY